MFRRVIRKFRKCKFGIFDCLWGNKKDKGSDKVNDDFEKSIEQIKKDFRKK